MDTRPRHVGLAADPFWYDVLESARAIVFEWCGATRAGIAILSRCGTVSAADFAGGHPSRRDAALQPVDLQGQPMEVRELPRAAREEPIHLGEEQARLRGAPTRWEERPEVKRTGRACSRP